MFTNRRRGIVFVAVATLTLLFQNCGKSQNESVTNIRDVASSENAIAVNKSEGAGVLATAAFSQPAMLVHKHFGNPIIDVRTGQEPNWRSTHVANASIIRPWATGDGRWKMYLRGSGWQGSTLHDQIGLFYQDKATFSPFGPWQEEAQNPILKNGGAGSYDERHLLDTVVVKGEQDIYLYYKGVSAMGQGTFSGAVSQDGGQSFIKFGKNPMATHVGPSDVAYVKGEYYFYYGTNKWNPQTGTAGQKLQIMVSKSKAPNDLGVEIKKAIPTGAVGTYDSAATNGAKIFRVPGDLRWFMVYQVSAKNFDYPERVHVAYSSDLINWTKVINSQPFMLRGNVGEWDQGAVWTSDAFVHQNTLYFYYEGWGSFGDDSSKRDTLYYPGGNSRLGVASISVEKFLSWVAGSPQLEGPVYKVENVHSGKVMDVAGYLDTNGANIHQWSFLDVDNQKFEFINNSDGTYSIRPLFSRRCVDVAGESISDFANIHLWDCWGGNNQKWRIYSVGKDTYAIINVHSGKALEVYGGLTVDGGNINQYPYYGYNNQKWRLIRQR